MTQTLVRLSSFFAKVFERIVFILFSGLFWHIAINKFCTVGRKYQNVEYSAKVG